MAAVKATVYYVGGPVAVCSLKIDGETAVAEARVDPDGTVRILAHTVRKARVERGVEVVMPPEPTRQDEVDRLGLQFLRFRTRLKKFDRGALDGTVTGRVRAQARAAVRDIGRLFP